MNDTFTACFHLPEGKDLGTNDAVPIIEAAIQTATGRFSRFLLGCADLQRAGGRGLAGPHKN
jgi:hypothetical protein